MPLPAAKAVLAIQFDDLLDALGATPAILRHEPSAVEVMDAFILNHTKMNPDLHRLRRRSSKASRRRCCASSSPAIDADDLPPRIDALEADLRARGLGIAVHRAIDPAAQQADLARARSGARPVDVDEGRCESPVVCRRCGRRAGAAARLHPRLLALVARHGTEAGVYAHASVGCLHVRPVVNLKTDGGRAARSSPSPRTSPISSSSTAARCPASTAMASCAARSWSACSDRSSTTRSADQADVRSGRHLQSRQDRRCAADHARICASAPRIVPRTWRRPSTTPSTAGFAGAVEMCSGLGACRKGQPGTMCPSFMATREEAHSTRGRANALRLALSGKLGEAGLADDARTRGARSVPRVPGVQDRVSGRRRRRAHEERVPVRVLARRGTPAARSRARSSRSLARWGSRFAPISNASRAAALVRWLNERLLGLDRRRTPPAWDAADVPRAGSAASSPARRRRSRRRALRRHLHESLSSRESAWRGST